MQPARSFHCGREFRHRNTILYRVGDIFLSRVIVAGERNLILMGERDDLTHVGRGIRLLIVKALLEQRIELGVGFAAPLAAIIVAELDLIAELALPRRVVHQRHQPHVRPVDQLLGFFDHARHRDFAAQVQKVIGAKQVRIARGCDRFCEHACPAVNLLGAILAPDPQRIQHGGDAGSGQLSVVGNHRRDRIPKYLWARHIMHFQMVGVQFDQAGHDQVTTGILTACGRIAFAELGDAAVGESNPAALDHAIGQHDAGVTEDGFLPCHLTFFLYAAAANNVTSTIRSAIRWRISSSWTIAAIATP